MRFILSVFIMVLTLTVQAQNWNDSKISTDLLEQLQKESGDHIPILVTLTDQVDVMGLQQRFRAQRLNRQQRVSQLIGTLKEKADKTQGEVLDLIHNSNGAVTESVKTLWVCNMIGLKANKSLIARLSLMDAVELIEVDEVVELVGFKESAPAPYFFVDGAEPGLLAINAHKLWAMGYTGYGRAALIIDSGTDSSHPALRGNYRGLYVPENQAWTGVSSTAIDYQSHGSHVGGTVCGLDRVNNDTIGVAFNALWMAAPLIFENGAFTAFSTFQTFQWALNPDGNASTTDDMPDVINNSWGIRGPHGQRPTGFECNQNSWRTTFNSMEAGGIAVVFAAGNEGDELGEMSLRTPGNVNYELLKSFTVAAVNGNFGNYQVAGFSSRGPSICGGQDAFLIKPEVAAPGVAVRSSVPGGYDLNSGTSMAAPHVSGAILLLKEAFPQIDGQDLVRALYETCVDLGDPGEDNDYGRGIIDVMAAFNYLVDQGNTPTDPKVDVDALLVNIDFEDIACYVGGLELVVTIENSGEEELTAIDLDYTIAGSNPVSGSASWSGSLMKGERTEFSIIVDDSNLREGIFTLTGEITNVNGGVDQRILNNKLRYEIFLLDVEGQEAPTVSTINMAEACEESPVLLQSSYQGDGIVQWYDEKEDGQLLGEGQSYLTPPLASSQTFYMDVVEQNKIGKESRAGSNRLDDETDAGLVFDAYFPFVIKSVKVFADEGGIRLISLVDLDDNIYAQKIINVPAGESRINLNIVVPVQDNLVLQLEQGKGLYVNVPTSGFPFEIPGLASIKRSRALIGGVTRYYYFYDWEVEYADFCGRVPVNVEVTPSANPPEAAFDISTDMIDLDVETGTVDFTDQSTGSVSWLWAFGNGDTSTDQNPQYTFAEAGTYVVSQTVINADGCTDAVADTIIVQGGIVGTLEEGRDYRLSLQPNPAQSVLNIQLSLNQVRDLKIDVIDILGRSVKHLNQGGVSTLDIELDVQHLTRGIYFVVFNLEDTKVVKKLILVD